LYRPRFGSKRAIMALGCTDVVGLLAWPISEWRPIEIHRAGQVREKPGPKLKRKPFRPFLAWQNRWKLAPKGFIAQAAPALTPRGGGGYCHPYLVHTKVSPNPQGNLGRSYHPEWDELLASKCPRKESKCPF
jgi:hypothetical protein